MFTLTIPIGLILSSAFSAIVVYAQELMPGKVGMVTGLFFGLAFLIKFAAEHVSLQVKESGAVLAKLVHAGAVFIGPFSPVAAGDYIAGPSHCLPTNTTARFSSGISVYEFLKRSSVVEYSAEGLAADAEAIVALATAEQLAGHAASVHARSAD